MLEDYYGKGIGDTSTPEQRQRLVAVEAALQITLAAAAGKGVATVLNDLGANLSRAADNIEIALKVKTK
ncbi:hypothetical protein DEI76_19025 [Salmonella enterica subsp. enterica serovar Agona]|nr:hypothetical protein [Salmonella enterica subsp. enterica serovar Agona]MBH0572032.1 hypothetical protein [Salmonella enterica]MBH0603282.1 hypothetical protein [Salmonella enterica]MBH0611904.1 hypothetical protein [Salmonella enterica]